MRNVQKSETREERKVTQNYTMDPMEGFPSDPLFPPRSNDLNNFFRTPSPSGSAFPRLMDMDNSFDFSNPASSMTNNHDRQHHSTVTTFNGLGNGVQNFPNQQQFNNSQNGLSQNQTNLSEPGKYVEIIPLGGNIGPEDLTVTLKDHVMTIEAKKETKTNSGSGTSTSYQEFTKKFTLPPGVDMRQVKSMLTPDGNLKIEAPLPQKALPAPPQRRERDVQIRIQ